MPGSSENLAEAISMVLDAPQDIAQMSAESRRHAVDKFDVRKISAAFLQVYAEPRT
jgi:hypothetical protein